MNIISYVEDQQVEVIQRLQLELQDSNYRLTEVCKDRQEIWEEKRCIAGELIQAKRDKAEQANQIQRLTLDLKASQQHLDDVCKALSNNLGEKMDLRDELLHAERDQVDLKFEIIKLRKENADLHIELLECKADELSLEAKVEQSVSQADRWGFLHELETTDS